MGTNLSSFRASNRGLGTVATLIGLIVVIAVTVVVTLAVTRRAPTFVPVGTGVASTAIPLHREPNETTDTTGAVSVGELVEILQYLPPKALDSWVLIRSTHNKKVYGYAMLRDLDQLKTNNADLDFWHATKLLEKANGEELQKRLQAMGERLKTPPPPSPAADQIYRTLAVESLRLANDRIYEPDEARALVASADTYLNRTSAGSEAKPEDEEIRSAMQKVQIALGDIPNPEQVVKAPAPPSPSAQLSRLLKDGNAAYDSGRYARASDLAQQVITKGQGKRENASLVDQAKALLKKAETSQEEFEKNLKR
jgi:hypothetical protein